MRKTLYSQIFLTFLGVIIFSLVTASLIGLKVAQNTVNKIGQNDMIAAAQEIIATEQEFQPADHADFIQRMAKLSTYPIHIYNEKEVATFYSLNNNNQVVISNQAVKQVLKGQLYRSDGRKEETFVGIPFTREGQRYAMFLQYSYQNERITNYLLGFILLMTIVIGSLCMVVAGRYLVKPLKELNSATKELAKGNFDVEVSVKRQDEIGELAASFNEMGSELKQIEQMRQDFVSNVSHEIQSPLTSIVGFAQALKNQRLIPEENRLHYLEIIIEESQRLSGLGDNLLKLASLDSEHHPFVMERVELVEQIRQIIVHFEPQWSKKKIEIELVNRGPISIQGDQELLKQVWVNLINNSLKFTPESGEILIKVTEQDEEAIVTVSDTGVGIVAEDLSLVFQRFYKTDKSRNLLQSGNGLGLAIVKKITEMHQGQVSVESRLGYGSTFTVRLPKLS